MAHGIEVLAVFAASCLLGSGARAIEKQTFCEKRRRRMRQDVVSVLKQNTMEAMHSLFITLLVIIITYDRRKLDPLDCRRLITSS
jgi:hypothetical protein